MWFHEFLIYNTLMDNQNKLVVHYIFHKPLVVKTFYVRIVVWPGLLKSDVTITNSFSIVGS